MFVDLLMNRPFAVSDHMVQKPPCWRANYPLGHPKQKNIKLSCFVLDVPVGSLLSSMAVFAPCGDTGSRITVLKVRIILLVFVFALNFIVTWIIPIACDCA